MIRKLIAVALILILCLSLTALHGVDFFKRTAHIESIAILEKSDTLKESR